MNAILVPPPSSKVNLIDLVDSTWKFTLCYLFSPSYIHNVCAAVWSAFQAQVELKAK